MGNGMASQSLMSMNMDSATIGASNRNKPQSSRRTALPTVCILSLTLVESWLTLLKAMDRATTATNALRTQWPQSSSLWWS